MHVDARDKHHIIAKADYRAAAARYVYVVKCKMNINDYEVNIAKVKRKYYQVLHTTAYHFIISTSVVANYATT